MSDDDFMQDSDQEEYDFEYEEDDEDQEANVGVENTYYNAKQLKSEDPEDALAQFLSLPGLEAEKGDWGFKGYKQAIKLEIKLKRYDDAVEHYRELLTYVKSAVTRNYSEKSITNLLDYVEKHADSEQANDFLETIYELTLESFQSSNNERLWLKTNIKLARLWFAQKHFNNLSTKLRELRKACQKPDGTDDPSKGTNTLEIYALEIQMLSETRDNKRLKALYQRALQIKSAVPHPKIMGIIRECGGKMNLAEENWEEAYSDFFESFKNYDEAGSLQRIQVLKYLVLTTMLMKSSISPFESQETKPYKDDGRISAMTRLVDAYQRDDVHAYMLILRDNQDLLADSFIAENIDEVTRNMRTKAMIKLIAPYSQFKLSFVSDRLNMPRAQVLEILRDLIIIGQLKGKIDLQKETVQLYSGADTNRTEAVESWGKAVNSLWAGIMSEGVGQGDEGMGDIPGGEGRSYETGRQRGGGGVGGGKHHSLKGSSVLR